MCPVEEVVDGVAVSLFSCCLPKHPWPLVILALWFSPLIKTPTTCLNRQAVRITNWRSLPVHRFFVAFWSSKHYSYVAAPAPHLAHFRTQCDPGDPRPLIPWSDFSCAVPQDPLSQLRDLVELKDQLEDIQRRVEDEIQAGVPPVRHILTTSWPPRTSILPVHYFFFCLCVKTCFFKLSPENKDKAGGNFAVWFAWTWPIKLLNPKTNFKCWGILMPNVLNRWSKLYLQMEFKIKTIIKDSVVFKSCSGFPQSSL